MTKQASARLLTALLLLAFSAAEADAQVRRGRPVDTGPRWAPVAIGARFGYDQRASGEVLGVQLRVPVLRSGLIELAPSADMIFLTGLKEYQYGVSVDFVPGGPRGGVLIGGGVVWRDSVLAGDLLTDPRATYFGWVVGIGGKSGVGPVQLEASLRWVFLQDSDFRPNPVTLGLNYPFWNVGRTGS